MSLKKRMKKFFRETKPEQIIAEFEKLGYEFIDIDYKENLRSNPKTSCMTLHDKLKEILDEHEHDFMLRYKGHHDEDPIPSTIAAIIQAIEERLPGDHTENDFGYDSGWNAYREEVRKVLGEKL